MVVYTPYLRKERDARKTPPLHKVFASVVPEHRIEGRVYQKPAQMVLVIADAEVEHLGDPKVQVKLGQPATTTRLLDSEILCQ